MALKRSEERFRSQVTATAQIVWTTDPHGLVSGPLPGWQAYTGQSDEEIQGAGWAAALHPDDAARSLEVWKRSVETRSIYEVEYRIRRHDGGYRHFTVRGAPVLNDDGSVREWVGTCTDITDQKLAENRLRESEERLNLALKASGIGIWSWDVLANTIFWDDHIHPLFGLKPGTFPGRYEDFLNLVHADNREQVAEDVRCAVEEGAEYNNEYRVVWPDGTERALASRGTVYRNEAGQPIRMTGVCWDITEQRQVQHERDQFFTLSLDLMCVAQTDGYFRRLNPAFEATLGFKEEELLARPFLEFIHPDDREATVRAVEQLKTGAPLVNFENRYRCKDGSYRNFLWSCAPSETGLLYATARDITERKGAEERLRRAAADLERSNQELERFAYVSSHDLQEPLRTIGSFSQLLASRYRGRLDSDADEFIQFIVDGSNRMQTLINDLLTYSRVGTRTKPFAPVELEGVLEGVLNDLDLTIQETGTQVTHDPLPDVMGDDVQLRQLLQNLIGNAIRFRLPGQPARIHVNATRTDDAGWEIAVRDNGIGIEPQFFERVFIIFQRLHGRDEYPGTGIGLAVCKKIIERHGGRIWVESKPGQGSIFRFTLPDSTTTP